MTKRTGMIGLGKRYIKSGREYDQKKRTDKNFFRYYEIPRDSYVLALFGEEWNRKYGSKEKAFISITIWRWVTVIKGGV